MPDLTVDKVPKATGANVLADGYGVVTTVGDPGADDELATEQAVREALDDVGGGLPTGTLGTFAKIFAAMYL